MFLAYGIISVISLCMVGVCVIADKKRDGWLIWLFVSVALCNLGYFMISVSKDLGAALSSNRIAYLGSVFLPFFMFMMVSRFCRINVSKIVTFSLVAIGVIMLGITTSPGILPIYYKTVDIEFVNGAAKLVREYGPLHILYYIYLGGYMLSLVGMAVFSVVKKKITSSLHVILLLCTVFCNIVIWLAEQFLPRGFEWLSVSYVLTEALILMLYHLMQKQGLMYEDAKPSSYTIDVLLVIFLLLFANFIRIITEGTSPAMYFVSHMVVFIIYIGILVSWAISVYDRIVHKTIRRYLVSLVALMILWMLMRTLRLTVFHYVFPFGQWCWYAYYISMILIPQLCFFASKYIGKPEEYRMPKIWHIMTLFSFILIVGILTNDLHQWAFKFHMGYEAGWGIYKRTFLYYAAVVWIFVCIVMMITEAVKKCRIPKTHRVIWRPISMIAVGVLYTVLYTIDIDLFGFIEVTAALCFTVVAIWESCIKTGLIQSNTNYDELIKYSGLGLTIVDNNYKTYYSSLESRYLTKEQMQKSKTNPIMIRNGVRVSSLEIHGGYTLWQEDLSELLDVLEELMVIREELKDSNAVSMENYQLDKQIRVLTEKNRLHDELYRQTSRQIELLNIWLKELIASESVEEKKELLRRIVVMGAYIKRRNNLILVNEQDGIIKAREFELSINEMVKNLQLAGINSACVIQFDRDLPASAAMQLFDFFEYVVENAFDSAQGLLARFFYRDNCFFESIDIHCNINLEKLKCDDFELSVSDDNYYTFSFNVKEGDCI